MLGFKSFIKEYQVEMPAKGSGLDVSREDMPQVEAKDYDAYIRYLKNRKITLTQGEMNPDDLKPIQKDFHKGGVERALDRMITAIKNGEKFKPIIVSKDNYVIDGHHRWIAHKNARMMIPVMKSNVNMNKLLNATHDFPQVKYKEIGTNKVIKK